MASGILEQSISNTHVLMTGAAHGFWDPGNLDGTKRIFGKAVQELPFTNIALVELQSGFEFTNITFEDENGNRENSKQSVRRHVLPIAQSFTAVKIRVGVYNSV